MTEMPTHAQTLREDFDKWFRRALVMTAMATAMSLTAFLTSVLCLWAVSNLRSEWIEARTVMLERAEASDVVRRSDADGRTLLTALEQIARAARRWEADMDRREAPAQIRQQREQHGTAPESRSLNELFGTGGFSRRSGQDARDDGQ